jgi:glyoxylase I family protein
MKKIISGFHHAAVFTADFDSSVSFYTDVLGLSKAYEWGAPGNRAVMMSLGGDSYLEIFEGGIPRDKTSEEGKPAGRFVHIALRTDDCETAFRRVKDAGMEIVSEVQDIDMETAPVYKVRIAFFKGPDGETIELFQVRE